jgi:hypothetical protein
MAIHILGQQQAPEGTPMVGPENEAEYQASRPINPLYEVCLMAAVHACDALRAKRIVVDMGLTEEQGRARADIGVFTTRLGPWGLTVNWTSRSENDLPPGHIGVDYSRTPVAILSPYLDMGLVYGEPQVNRWIGSLNCGVRVREEDLWEECAQVIPKLTGKDYHFEAFDGDRIEAIKRGGDG